MRKKKKKEYIITAIIILLLLITTSIGYAIVRKEFHINGNAQIGKATWLISASQDEINAYRNGVRIVDPDDIPTLTEYGAGTDNVSYTVSFNAILQRRNDYYEFTMVIRNKGTMDAILAEVINQNDVLPVNQPYLDYSIYLVNPGGTDRLLTPNKVYNGDLLFNYNPEIILPEKTNQGDGQITLRFRVTFKNSAQVPRNDIQNPLTTHIVFIQKD